MGESERLLRTLFEMAAEYSPSIIVLDEMDSLGRKRTGSESETERRIKTEFLRQMDSLQLPQHRGVYIVGTTNMPWELDIAVLRRFERKVLVPMPDRNSRIEIFRMHTGSTTCHSLTEKDFEIMADLTDWYSGSDISIICNEAFMKPVRMLQYATFFKPVILEGETETKWSPCAEGETNAVEKVLASI
jgi:vacuolar protein-sorting-associated protein 4